MNRLTRTAWMLAIAMALATSARVAADAYHVPLDGSDPFFKPATFGYQIEVTKADGRASVRIFLDAAAARAFSDGRLLLKKGRKRVMETVVGLQGRDGVADGVIAFSFDTRFVDDGDLVLWSGSVDAWPFVKNFAGFRFSIKQLLEPAAKKEIDPKSPPPVESGLTPEQLKRFNDQIRKSQDEQRHKELDTILTRLNGKLELGEPGTWLARMTQLELPVAEVIPIYIGLLDNQHDYVKSGAMEELARFGSRSKEAGPKLLRIFQEDKAVRWLANNAILAMARIDYYTPELIDEYIRLLEHPFPIDSTRLNVIKAVGMIGPPAKKALPALEKLLADKSTTVQFEAYRAQGLVHGERHPTVEELQQLKDLNWKERPDRGFAAFMGYQEAGVEAAFGVTTLLKILDNQPPAYVRAVSIETLGRIGGSNPKAIEAILKVFDPADPVMVTLCDQALRSVDGDNKECVAALGAGLLRPQPLVHQTAAVILAKLGKRAEPATASAIAALKAADERTNKDSIGALVNLLGKIGPGSSAAADLLIGLLPVDASIYAKRSEEDVKLIRAFVLAMLADITGSKKAMPYIREHLGSRDPYSFAAGARAAAALGPDAAELVPLLIVALDPKLPYNQLSFDSPFMAHTYTGTSTRMEAIRALGQIGPAAKEAIPLLEPLARPGASGRELEDLVQAALKKIRATE